MKDHYSLRAFNFVKYHRLSFEIKNPTKVLCV